MMVAGNVRPVFERLAVEDQIRHAIGEARELLVDQFGATRAVGVEMAVRALAGDMTEDHIRAQAPAFIRANFE